MNHFNFTKTLNDDNLPEKVEITLSPQLDDLIMDRMKEHWLMEILQGERKVLPDGQIYYCFELNSDDASALRIALLEAYTKHSGHNTPN